MLALLAPLPVHAACQLAASETPVELWLPATPLAVAADAPLGATLGTVQAAAPRDVRLTCTGRDNLREAALADVPAAPADVHPTSVPGIGMRITMRGGSFAGIDDAEHTVPYRAPMAPGADRLTGFGVRVSFIKTAPVASGALAAGTLMTLSMGDARVASVRVPADAITFQTLQCQRVTPHGMVEMGTGTLGSYTSESVGVQIGCGNGLNAVIGLETTQLYGRPDWSSRPAVPPAHAVADAGAAHVIMHAHGRTTNGGFATGATPGGADTPDGYDGTANHRAMDLSPRTFR